MNFIFHLFFSMFDNFNREKTTQNFTLLSPLDRRYGQRDSEEKQKETQLRIEYFELKKLEFIEICKRLDIEADIILFGSTLVGAAIKTSDLDICIGLKTEISLESEKNLKSCIDSITNDSSFETNVKIFLRKNMKELRLVMNFIKNTERDFLV